MVSKTNTLRCLIMRKKMTMGTSGLGGPGILRPVKLIFNLIATDGEGRCGLCHLFNLESKFKIHSYVVICKCKVPENIQ